MSEPIEAALRPYFLSIILKNEAGALDRVIGLFSGRGYTMESMSFAPINDNVSRLTIVCMAPRDDRAVITQIMHQIIKIHPVQRVRDLTDDNRRKDVEIAIIRIDTDISTHESIKDLFVQFYITNWTMGANEVHCTCFNMSETVLSELVAKLEAFGNVALARSGVVSLGGRYFDADAEIRK